MGITLVLEVGDEEKFISRYLETATPDEERRVTEHLLDGQQRLTALWRAFHNNYEWESYFIYLEEFDNYDKDLDQEDMTVFCRSRYYKKNGDKYPLWCDSPAKCLERGYIPTQLLKPEDIQDEIDDWLTEATASLEPEGGKKELKQFYDFRQKVSDRIKDLRSIVANYNLPYLSLPSTTDKALALDVFIKMNTNSKPLSQYDVIVAEVESVMGRSLHDLQESLNEKYPRIARYGELSDMILTTSALLQDALPNQRGAWDMNKRVMVDKWGTMERGLHRMVSFLEKEGIYDRQRLPTNAVLAVIAALYENIPDVGDKRGKNELLLKKYLWYAFFTDRYENAAATHAYADFIALKRLIKEEKKKDGEKYAESDIPIINEHMLVEKEEIMNAEWPKRASIRGRAVLAVACRMGAFDFATGEQINANNIEQRHYHHLYPDALLKEAEVNSFLALNCALIAGDTNLVIGRKEPLKYLKDRYNWTSELIVSERLKSHLIPVTELANGGYEGLSEQEKKDKIKEDFERFLQKRAEVIMKAVHLLVEGLQIDASVMNNDNEI